MLPVVCDAVPGGVPDAAIGLVAGVEPMRGSPPGAVTGRLLLALGCALCVLSMGCKKGPGGGAKKIPRDKDAQAVVIVDQAAEQVIEFIDEVEPNNEPPGQTLALQQGVRGNLDGETDVDIYAITVAQPGVLDARVSGIEGVDLVLELRDPAGAVLARSDRGPATVIEGIPNARVSAGAYQLVVSEFVKKRRKQRKKRRKKGAAEEPIEGRTGPSPTYELSARWVAEPEKGHEIEPNEERELAAEIVVGDGGRGFLGWSKDVDMWRLSVDGFAAEYSLDLDLTPVPGVTPTLTIRDQDGEMVLERQGSKDLGLTVRNLVVARKDAPPASGEPRSGSSGGASSGAGGGSAASGADDGGEGRFYYVELRARRSNPIDTYQLYVATRLLDVGDENEPNDQPATAVELVVPGSPGGAGTSPGVVRGDPPVDGVRNAHLTIGDVDHFRLQAGDAPLLVAVTARPLGDADLELSVLVDDQVVAMIDGGKAGASEALADVPVAAGKIAVIKVAGKGSLGNDARYELRWSAEQSGPGSSVGPDDDDGDDGGDDDDDGAGDPGVLEEYEDE